MAQFIAGLWLAAMAASAAAWAHPEARRAHSAPSPARAAVFAPQHRSPHVTPQAAIYHTYAPHPPRFASPPVLHPPIRPPVIVRPIIATYVPPRPVYSAPRVVAVPSPYYAVVGAGYTGTDLAYPAEPNWNWTPVESIAALAGRGVAERSDVRYYCPDSREYYPQAQTCPSPWLKVIP